MSMLRSKEEVLANTEKLYETYRFHLFHKGYRKAISREITVEQVEATREKYDLSESISDFEFGSIEGKIHFAMTLETFYDADFDEGHIAWIKGLIAMFIDQIWCFISKCAVNKPQISTSPAYNFAEQFDARLQGSAIDYQDEINNWYCTPYELGRLCGFISAAHWAIGDEWVFNESDFDVPIDWKRFHGYLDKRSSKLRQRKIREMSVVFQIFTNPRPRHGDGGRLVPLKGQRSKILSEPVGVRPDLPEVSSWSDW